MQIFFQSPLFEGGISLLWRMTHLAFSSFSSLTVCQLAALFKASIFIGKVNAVCPKILKFLHRYGVQRGNAIMQTTLKNPLRIRYFFLFEIWRVKQIRARKTNGSHEKGTRNDRNMVEQYLPTHVDCIVSRSECQTSIDTQKYHLRQNCRILLTIVRGNY